MIKSKIYLTYIVFISLLGSFNTVAMEEFPLSAVRITDGPFFHAQETNKKYVLALDTEKLLAPFRREAGLPFETTYGNWESTGLDGHIGGHYISALAYLAASTGDKTIEDRLTYVVNELKKVQDAIGSGYIGGVPNSKAFVAEIEKGELKAELFSLNGRWVPWYNLHKTYAGLRDAYQLTGNQTAKAMLIKYADWADQLATKLGTEKMQTMLHSEHGSMNEVLVDVYQITGDKKYLALADKFSQRTILEPLLHQQDKLTGNHANTQIPKVVGYKKVADATNNKEWHQAASFFWDTVINHRSVAIGGNSVREHFHSSEDFTPMLEDPEGPETCNTYNMLKLSRLLYNGDQNPKYMDYYERGLFNHILSSQHPTTGGFVYFTSMRPNHYRVYSQVHEGMWCCVGSGLESQSKYGEYIYTRDYADDKTPEVFVNLWVSADVNWAEEGIVISQKTLFPDSNKTQIRIDSNKTFSLKLRYPHWAEKGKLKLSVNGKKVTVKAKAGEYITLKRAWKKGDLVSFEFPMHATLEQLPDGKNFYAVLYGPIVLAAKTDPFKEESLNYFADDSRMGHIASGQLCPLENAPFLLGNSDKFISKLKREKSDQLAFSARGIIDGQDQKNIELIPFFRLHESRYTVYFPQANSHDIKTIRAQAATAEKEKLLLAKRTIDSVQPGQQQPESDHFYQGEQSEMGLNGERHWRHAYKWFSYQLNNTNKELAQLQLTFASADQGREFSIYADEILIADVILTSETTAFYSKTYSLPESITKKSNFRVKLVAKEGSIAGGLYELLLLRE